MEDFLIIDGVLEFYRGNALSLRIPDSVSLIRCTALRPNKRVEEIIIPASVTEIESGAFWELNSLERIVVAEDNPVYSSIGGHLYSKDGKTILQYATGCKEASFKLPDGVVEIGDSAFRGCVCLAEAIISKGVARIGNSAFNGCPLLSAVHIPSSVTTIGQYAFSGCDKLLTVKIPYGVKKIENECFCGCKALLTVSISNGVE